MNYSNLIVCDIWLWTVLLTILCGVQEMEGTYPRASLLRCFSVARSVSKALEPAYACLEEISACPRDGPVEEIHLV